ncbi:capsid cement protein [Oleispirillum naphthae]|uniref:capsid cement protein n=1 Tax=Oleispirillum naphthae TaxID=2838853 RepID=UPI0030822A88
MRNYVQEGRTLSYYNSSGATISAGAAVVVGGQVGVAINDIADGASGTLSMEGVYTLPKTSGAAINVGTAPIFDVSAGAFVPAGTATAAGDITGAVTAWATAASADTTVNVKIGVGNGAVASGT